MKKQLQTLTILLTIIFSSFSFLGRTLIPAMAATYVEGPITQDTIWTMVDSPFVVSKDVTVYPNATLTIEQGVEVKFGENLSLIVSGKLYANGTGKTIAFISNKETPGVGDWDAIIFNGVEKSTLINCYIAHAKNGILVENSELEIENSTVTLSQNAVSVVNGILSIYNSTVSRCNNNGINATSSEFYIQNSFVEENQGNGIYITGDGQVTIYKNSIIANGNGMLLTGSVVNNVNITQNIVSANTQNGTAIDAINHANIDIVKNTFSSNNNGFYISSPTSTYLTNNSISYNTIGILYNNGTHTANYNDIYGNELGMDVLSNDTINAEYNYWGDQSGPYHASLNPYGKGNRVGGDGSNLDFIFFLANPIGHINFRPTASLWTDRVWAQADEAIMFFATNSSDTDGRINRYFFDFNDGTDTGWITLSVFSYKYSAIGSYFASLRVMDDCGVVSNTINTTIYIRNLPPLQVRLDLSSPTVHEGEQVSITVYVTNGTVAINNAAVTLFSTRGGEFLQSSGVTNASGYFVTNFTAPDITETVNIRIVARASRSGVTYVDGAYYEYLEVSPFLSVQVDVDPDTVKSEESAQVTVHVRSNEQDIVNASVTISSDAGELSQQTGYTGSDGTFSVVFIAPKTTTPFNVNITATATKNEYMSGEGYALLTVEPKILAVEVTAEPNATLSEAEVNVTVHVEYEATFIVGANVTITAESGNLSTTTGLTDNYGNMTFVFTTPPVSEQANVTVMIQVTMMGYAEAQEQLIITVSPRTFYIQIIAPSVKSGESAIITVIVTCNEDGNSVVDAVVAISSTDGGFDAAMKITDSTGTCTFIFSAPLVVADLPVTITANATKSGYVDGETQTTVTVTRATQAEGGFPLIMMLLIITIPIVILVVVIILIRLKIISISTGEEAS